MSVPLKAIEAPLSPEELARRWRALAQDPTFEDVAGTLEIYTREGLAESSAFPVPLDGLFDARG